MKISRQRRCNSIFGEGQLYLNNVAYTYHLEHFFEAELTYNALLKLLLNLEDSGKLSSTVLTLFLSILISDEATRTVEIQAY